MCPQGKYIKFSSKIEGRIVNIGDEKKGERKQERKERKGHTGKLKHDVVNSPFVFFCSFHTSFRHCRLASSRCPRSNSSGVVRKKGREKRKKRKKRREKEKKRKEKRERK